MSNMGFLTDIMVIGRLYKLRSEHATCDKFLVLFQAGRNQKSTQERHSEHGTVDTS